MGGGVAQEVGVGRRSSSRLLRVLPGLLAIRLSVYCSLVELVGAEDFPLHSLLPGQVFRVVT